MSYKFKKLVYYTAENREYLTETLDTQKEISKKTAKILISNRIYVFYSFDKRIKCNRFILNDFSNDLGLPLWIHIYRR